MMNSAKIIIVVCEGASEWAYIQALNSFIESLPFQDGYYDAPIRFVGKPKKTGVGKGAHKAAEKVFREVSKCERTAETWVWVDADLYVRNDKSCGTLYKNRPKGIPPFHFSIFNFEDFLALHLCDADFHRWIKVMSSAGHFNHPLHNADYEVQFEGFIPGYKKGNLPPDFITVASLKNLKRHIALLPHMNLNNLSVHKTFATSLIDELEQCYPNLLN